VFINGQVALPHMALRDGDLVETRLQWPHLWWILQRLPSLFFFMWEGTIVQKRKQVGLSLNNSQKIQCPWMVEVGPFVTNTVLQKDKGCNSLFYF
jgi:hypothetical protein